MTIDTKRLETDGAYWRECGAPEDATHYCPVSKLFYDDNYPIAPCCIPRPTTPAAPEWDGEGFPPVGTVCEKAPHWHKCEIVAEHDGGLVVYDMHSLDYYKVGLGMNFRPLRTKEQRQREELAKVLADSFDATYEDCLEAAEAAIAAGWAKP